MPLPSYIANHSDTRLNPVEMKRLLIKKAYRFITDRDRPVDPSSIQSRIDLIRLEELFPEANDGRS